MKGTSRRWYVVLAIIAVVGIYLGRKTVDDDGPAIADDDGGATHAQKRTFGPDLADALGRARAKRSGAIDWDPSAPQIRDGVVISGSVQNVQTHQAVGNVEVVFRGPTGEESAMADATGKFSLQVPLGIYRAFVRDDRVISVGYPDRERIPGPPSADTAGVPDEVLMTIVMANRDVDGLDLSVVEGATVKGKVVDGSGRAIAGAVVEARGMLRPTLGTDVAESDDKGEFELRVPGGSYGVVATHPRYAGVSDSERLYVTPGQATSTTITLVAGCVITGRVVTSDGKPGPDGMIEQRWGETDDEFGPSTRIEPDGTFRWTRAEPGATTVTLRAWPWKSPHSEAKVFECREGARFANVEFKIPSTAPDIEGVLVDANGQPIPFGFVDLQPLDPGGLAQQERADAEGKWAVFAMPKGRYHLTASAEDRGIASLEVTSPQTAVRVALGGTGRIEGTTTTLVDGSFELSLTTCWVGDASIQLGQQRRLVSVHAGHFEVENVPACQLQFTTEWQGRRAFSEADVPVNGIARVQLDIGPRRVKTVTGRVTYAGKPVAGAHVVVIEGEDEDPAHAITDGDGRYTIKTFSGAYLQASDDEHSAGHEVGMANVDTEIIDLVFEDEPEEPPYDDESVNGDAE